MQDENRGPVSGGSNTPEGKKLDHVTIVYESKEVRQISLCSGRKVSCHSFGNQISCNLSFAVCSVHFSIFFSGGKECF